MRRIGNGAVRFGLKAWPAAIVVIMGLSPAAHGQAREAGPSAATAIAEGRSFYANTCTVCHGPGAKTSGITPDLRHSPIITDRNAFNQVVAGGILADQGMVSFGKNFTSEQIEAIRAYLIARA